MFGCGFTTTTSMLDKTVIHQAEIGSYIFSPKNRYFLSKVLIFHEAKVIWNFLFLYLRLGKFWDTLKVHTGPKHKMQSWNWNWKDKA